VITTWQITLPDGSVTQVANLDEARAVVQRHPEAEVKPKQHYRACPEHPAYEPANCPLCGTARALSR